MKNYIIGNSNFVSFSLKENEKEVYDISMMKTQSHYGDIIFIEEDGRLIFTEDTNYNGAKSIRNIDVKNGEIYFIIERWSYSQDGNYKKYNDVIKITDLNDINMLKDSYDLEHIKLDKKAN